MMRGCHTAAFLRMMDVNDTIANSMEEYIGIAARLALDVSWRIEMKEKIRMNKFRLYRDNRCIAVLEEFLEHAALGGGRNGD
jgi:predicted O-linked N-acetylglucosamine transferase (SPINDLY family)